VHLTVARLAPERYYIVTGTGFATHDFDWIARNIPRGMDARVRDVTSSRAVLALMGPVARDVLQRVTRDDVSNAAFGFGQVRQLSVAGAPVLALRVTYVGELGWELHVPMEYAATVYDALMETGAGFGIVNAGYRAIETLRLEKATAPGGGHRTRSHAVRGGSRLGGETRERNRLQRARSVAGAAISVAHENDLHVHRRRSRGDVAGPRDHLPQ
jgi:4-methylaminobutanoate oxidase (formaldehyde-forming)